MRFAPIILVYTSARVWKDIRVMALIVEVSNLLLFLQGNFFSSYLAGEAIREKSKWCFVNVQRINYFTGNLQIV